MDSTLPLDKPERPIRSSLEETAAPKAPPPGGWTDLDNVLADLDSISKQILNRPKKPGETSADEQSGNGQ